VRVALAHGAALEAVAAAVEMHLDAVAPGCTRRPGAKAPAVGRCPRCWTASRARSGHRSTSATTASTPCAPPIPGLAPRRPPRPRAALLEPPAGVELSAREWAVVDWLACWDVPTIAPLVGVLHAARAAAPLGTGVLGDRRGPRPPGTPSCGRPAVRRRRRGAGHPASPQWPARGPTSPLCGPLL
jgi:hypothetical protein